jgi:predicted metal-dependent hydrolase
MKRRTAKTTGSSTPSVQLLKVDGISAPVEVRRHPKARRLTLRVSRTQHAVILTMPRSSDLREADRFLLRNRDWVRERLECVPEPVPLVEGAAFPLRGVPHEIAFEPAQRGAGVVEIVARAGRRVPVLIVHGTQEHAPRRLRDWLYAEAARDLQLAVTRYAKEIGVKPQRITLRDQKTRWGSCSSSGQLSFSWRLLLAPPVVLDYVAAHEVAHLVHMNHGPRFWRLVDRIMPRSGEAKAWLRIHGMDLYRYDVGT